MLLGPACAVQQHNYNKGNNDKYIEKILGVRVIQHWTRCLETEQDPEQAELLSKLDLL